jgi:hypothetical protein
VEYTILNPPLQKIQRQRPRRQKEEARKGKQGVHKSRDTIAIAKAESRGAKSTFWQKISNDWFRSSVLRVMSPAR